MVDIGSYRVRVLTQAGGEREAIISPAGQEDMPIDWTFSWQELWQSTYFDIGNIIKLVYDEQVWGLMRFSIYRYPDSPETLEIEHLETNSFSRGQQANRIIEPIGKWLIWYATQVALRYCLLGVNDTLVFLISLDSAVDYYRDIIEMEYVGATNIAPGEDGYIFKFSTDNAAAFCGRQERQWGITTPVDS